MLDKVSPQKEDKEKEKEKVSHVYPLKFPKTHMCYTHYNMLNTHTYIYARFRFWHLLLIEFDTPARGDHPTLVPLACLPR